MLRQVFIYTLWLILFGGILSFSLFFPVLQSRSPRLNAPPPGGAYVKTSWPNFTLKKWFKGEYQKTYDLAYKRQHPASNFMLRQRNQFLLDIWQDPGTKNVIIGNNGYLFSPDYTNAAFGKDFVGSDSLDRLISKLEHLDELLADHQKELIIITPPGQVRGHQQWLPSYYQAFSDSSNWVVFSKKMETSSLNAFSGEDLLAPRTKDEFQYYPQLGLHWTMYGASVTLEKVMQYINTTTPYQSPTVSYKIDPAPPRIEQDFDLLYGANFLYAIAPHSFPVPKITYHSDSTACLPKVLIVGDSFYEMIYKQQVHDNIFAPESSFWYYNNKVFPQGGNTSQLDLAKEIEDKDVIILVAAEWNIPRMGWGFLDQLKEVLQ